MRFFGKRQLAALSVALLLVATVMSIPGRTQASGYGSVSNDTYLLARLIYAEAAGEPYQGKVAVGAVVVNRTKSGIFPSSISGVIYDPWQFSSVGDWMFNSAPSQDCVSAAVDALSGTDPTGGALYYFNYHLVSNSWLWSKPHATTIGNHWFTF